MAHDRTFVLDICGIDRELSLALVARAADEHMLIREVALKILRDELLPDTPLPPIPGRQTPEEFIAGVPAGTLVDADG
jgi:hypothetical protein